MPLPIIGGKAGEGLKLESGYRFDCARRLWTFPEHFSAKRRMGPVRQTNFGGIRRMPSFSVLRDEGFFYWVRSVKRAAAFFPAGLSTQTAPPWSFGGAKLKDQP
jgi:hypothetical protein